MRQRDKVVPLPVDRLQELEGSSERSEGSEADAEEAAGPAGARWEGHA